MLDSPALFDVQLSVTLRCLRSLVGDTDSWIAAENGYFLRRGGSGRAQWEVRVWLLLPSVLLVKTRDALGLVCMPAS